jgi:hypothetical protein
MSRLLHTVPTALELTRVEDKRDHKGMRCSRYRNRNTEHYVETWKLSNQNLLVREGNRSCSQQLHFYQ